jgi:MFS superfamily sulfate permease-like transporter
LGTSKQLSLGPDALSSLLIGIILAGKVKNGEEAELVVTAISFMVGLVCLGLGLLRVGFLDNVLSRPLLCGFVNAVAVTIIFEQSDVFFGLPARGKHGWEKVVTSFQDIGTLSSFSYSFFVFV